MGRIRMKIFEGKWFILPDWCAKQGTGPQICRTWVKAVTEVAAIEQKNLDENLSK